MDSSPELDRVGAERRRALKMLGLGSMAAAFGCWADRSLAPVAAEPTTSSDSRPTAGRPLTYVGVPRALEILRRPIELSSGDVLENRRILLSPDFAWTPSMAAIYGKGSGIAIRNVELVGSVRWESRWDRYTEPDDGPPGIPAGCAGIRLQEAPGVRVEDVTVRGFPGPGITSYGVDEAMIRGIRVSDCFHGVVTEWYRANHRVVVDDVDASNLWGPAPGKWPNIEGPPSRLRSKGFIGGDGLVLASLRDSIVRNCRIHGEQFASLKLVNPQRVQVSGVEGVGIMVQGTSDLEWKIDRAPARDVTITSCIVDKSLGTGAIADEGNGFQISWNVESILIRSCTLRAAGRNGHGIEFAKNVHGKVEGCTIEGFNGRRFANPAYAISIADNSSINPDFDRVNTFLNQGRLIDRRP